MLGTFYYIKNIKDNSFLSGIGFGQPNWFDDDFNMATAFYNKEAAKAALVQNMKLIGKDAIGIIKAYKNINP